MISYPAGPVTPHGAYYIKNDILPNFAYYSPNLGIVFYMLCGRSIPDYTVPESVHITSLKGLIPPWQNIEQKGSTQDGSSYITSLYDPMDIELGVRIRGRDPIYTRKVVSDWLDSWDAKTEGTLVWYTQEMGVWWAHVREGKPPIDAFTGGIGRTNQQDFTMLGKAYDAFWLSYDNLDVALGDSIFKFMTRLNLGDQPMFDDYYCIGPGTFYFQDGPNSGNYVVYGPIGAGQAVQISTDPRKRGVIPLYGNINIEGYGPVNVGAPFSVNPYSLLDGRFSDNAGIPPKPPGVDATPSYVWVQIVGGNSGSAIVSVGTPKRRMPF